VHGLQKSFNRFTSPMISRRPAVIHRFSTPIRPVLLRRPYAAALKARLEFAMDNGGRPSPRDERRAHAPQQPAAGALNILNDHQRERREGAVDIFSGLRLW
jgi:hypothetical protein